MKISNTWALVLLALLVIGGLFVWKGYTPPQMPITTVTFTCDEGKTILATFYKESVVLSLSDGRGFTLPQAVSASGARYATPDESFVFWNKGNTAFINEGSPSTQTFSNCVTAGEAGQESSWNTYASTTLGFSIQYPESYVLNTAYKYDQLGPKEPTISGVKFTIPASMATGTNLSSFDTGVSVELMRGLPSCTAYPFLIQPSKVITVVDGNATYFVASSSGAGAGNFYEETIYALEGSDPCVAIRYYIHSTNIGNYEPGAVQEFDRTSLLDQFDKIRRSLQIISN